MGTTVSSLHVLGAAEEEVCATLSKADQKIAVFAAAGRFLTVCPGEAMFDGLDRKANVLSKKVPQPILAVSMFDGDDLDLSLFQGGRRLTRHVVNLEADIAIAGNAAVFCAALGLSDDMPPKLKRLLTDPDQEEKLSVLSALLGAPLFARWDTPESLEPVLPDAEPLDRWLSDHPLPPKLKNRCRGEVVREVLDLALDYVTSSVFIFRPLAYADAPSGQAINCGGYIYREKASDGRPVEGYYCSGGYWGRLQPDGMLELTPLREDGLQRSLENEYDGELDYAELDGRLVTYGEKMEGDGMTGWTTVQTVLLADTAGVLPLPLPIALNSQPRVADRGKLRLLPDGGFSVALAPLYHQPKPFQPPDLVAPAVRAVFGPDGTFRATEPMDEPRNAFSDHSLTLGDVDYRYELQGHQRDAVLCRLSDGAEAVVPRYSTLALSPDGTRLYAAGFRSGLAVLDAASHRVLGRLERKDGYHMPLADQENRLWVGNGGFLECYAPNLVLISRHRLAGDLLQLELTDDGAVLAITYQRTKFHTRVYRFTPPEK